MAMEEKGVPVVIQLSSLISYDGIADDPLQMMTTGTWTPGEKENILDYVESQEDQETGEIMEARTKLIIGKDQMTMNREGDTASTMMFKKNRRFETVYRTPFGEMPMSVFTRDIRCDVNDIGGTVYLKYELSLQGNYASTNEMHLRYAANQGRQ